MSETYIEELALRLDKFYSDFDHYEYMDCDGSPEQMRNILLKDPYTVISDLLDMATQLLD